MRETELSMLSTFVNIMQEIRRLFPVLVVSVPDSVILVSVLYRDPAYISENRINHIAIGGDNCS